VRPKKMFFEEVELDGYRVPRFREIARDGVIDNTIVTNI